MESNTCDINQLDADVLLPPRKRLLAGLKRQNSDVNSPGPSTSSSSGSEFDIRLNNILKSHLSNPNVSNEEIVEASRKAALEAVKAAEAARAAAEEKAAKAAKAVAAAKSALELVATISEETTSRDRVLKKNKMKKHVPVQTLYSKQKGVENCRTDEELARKLHQVINSSPRISKNSSGSDLKNHKRKRLKTSSPSEKNRPSNGHTALEGSRPSTSYRNGIVGELDSEGPVHEGNMLRVDLNSPKCNKADQLNMESGEALKFTKADQMKMDKGEAETVNSKQKFGESPDDTFSNGRKKGKLKQKKLPLSICNFRDEANPKEELKSGSLSLTEGNVSNATGGGKPLFNVGSSGDQIMSVERTSLWKCQAFKAPACVKQNKVTRS